MTSKKEILSELKKFNNDLEKHLPNLNLDNVQNVHSSNSSNTDEDYFSLLANNLMELRTEMALTRKNLSVEIEGMVLRSISEQQNKFFEQIKKFYGVIIMEMKENFSEHMRSVSEDLNNLKRKYTEVSIQNESFANNLNDAIIDLKNMKNQVDDSTGDIRQTNLLSKKNFNEMLETLDHLTSDVNKKNMYFEDKVLTINKKFSKIELSLEEIKDKIDEDIEERNKDELRRIKTQTRNENFVPQIDEDTVEEIKRNAISAHMRKIKESEDEVSQNVKKISEIDEKLKRLSSLR